MLQNIGIGYQQSKKETSVSAQKKLIDQAPPKIQSNLVSRASSLVQLTI